MGFFRFAKIGSLLRITTIKTADRQVLKMATGCLKWFPAVFRDGFLTIQTAKMAAIWRIFAGLWVFTPLECIERVSMRFNGVFIFALRCFRLTPIFMEGIIVIKRGTTVLGPIVQYKVTHTQCEPYYHPVNHMTSWNGCVCDVTFKTSGFPKITLPLHPVLLTLEISHPAWELRSIDILWPLWAVFCFLGLDSPNHSI